MIISYEELQAHADANILKAVPHTLDDLRNHMTGVQYPQQNKYALLFVPAQLVPEFKECFPVRAGVHEPFHHTMASRGALSAFYGIPVLTDLFAHPAVRMDLKDYTMFQWTDQKEWTEPPTQDQVEALASIAEGMQKR